MKKKLLSLLLALCLVMALVPMTAFAEGSTETPPVCSCETACTADTMNKECPVCGAENAIPQNCGQYIPVEDRTGENSSTEGADDLDGATELSAADQVQAMINALPSAEAITEDNTEEVKAQLEAIDEAKAQLSDEELDQLDFSLYTEAASALGGLAKPMLTDSTKKISVRMNAKNGKSTDSVSDGVSTAYGTTHTLTVTPQTGRYVIAGYFAGTDYYKTNPAKYQYSKMTLHKISEADSQTGAVQYQFTATEVIPISNDPNYDYICLYFHCAKLPTLLWTLGNISGEATAPSTDGNTAAIPYVSQKELCGDPNEYTGYYSLADKKDRPYLDWQVISITDKEGNTAGGTVAFDNNHLTYTPTANEAGKTVTITIRPKLGYVEEANTPLSFEIEVKKPVVEQSEFNVTMVIDGYGNAVARPNSAKEGEEIQLTAIPDRGHHFKEWQATSGTSGKIMITNDKFTMPAGNVTVKAIFEADTYTVKLHANGGTIASGQDVTSYTYGTGAALPTADDMTYTGYTFKGWYDNEGLTGDPVTAIGDTETGDKEYWAKWTINQYTITVKPENGEVDITITQNYGTPITAPTLTRDGYQFNGWDKAFPTTMPAEDLTITAQWRDIAVPTGEIKIAENDWKSFFNTITFDLFFKETQTVTITAADNSGEAVTIEYLLSDKELTQAELAGMTFTAYSAPFNINPDNEYVVYAKLTDTSGNVAYINTDGIVLDATVPGISGIADGKIYCAAQIVTVDEKYIDTVKVNGNKVTLDSNNQFTLNPAVGEQTIVVTDKAGNETRVIVTVNDGHTYEWQSENGQYWQKCKFCNHETAKKDIPTINISGADKVCRTQDYKFSFTLPEGATDAAYGYEFIGLGDGPLTPTFEGGMYCGVIKSAAYPAEETSFKLIVSAKTADGFEFSAEKTVAIQNAHSGGTATCTNKAVCEICGESYGEFDPNNHANLKHIDAKAATKTSEGNIEYWYCSGCKKYYKDATATQEIKQADTVTAKLPGGTVKPGADKSPQTGDNSNLLLWIALLFISGGAAIGTTVVSRKKKYNR